MTHSFLLNLAPEMRPIPRPTRKHRATWDPRTWLPAWRDGRALPERIALWEAGPKEEEVTTSIYIPRATVITEDGPNSITLQVIPEAVFDTGSEDK